MKQVKQGMIHPVMLYKHPGPHLMGKEYFDYIIVDKCDEKIYDAALADGWFESMPTALENSTVADVIATAKLEADKKAKADAETKIIVEATTKIKVDAEAKEAAEMAEKKTEGADATSKAAVEKAKDLRAGKK